MVSGRNWEGDLRARRDKALWPYIIFILQSITLTLFSFWYFHSGARGASVAHTERLAIINLFGLKSSWKREFLLYQFQSRAEADTLLYSVLC
jgi:hypothetical protein